LDKNLNLKTAYKTQGNYKLLLGEYKSETTLRDLALTLPTLHLIHPLQMHVYLIDKFSLYNMMMAKICGRNM